MNNSLDYRMKDICVFYALFYSAYALNVYLESLGFFGDNATALSIIFGLLRGLLIWIVPVFLLLPKPLEYLKLKHNVLKGVLTGSILGILFMAVRVGVLYLWHGTVAIDMPPDRHLWMNVILFFPFSEEVVFRGFILQKIEKIKGFWVANCISTLLFVIYHIPHWWLIQHYSLQDMATDSVSLIWLSILFGVLLKKSQSLWSCVILHSCNNFMSSAIM